MINDHKPTAELKNNNNNNNSNNSNSNNSNNNRNSNNNNNNDDDDDDDDDDEWKIGKAEWKIQLIMKNNFISVKYFEDTGTIYSASKPVELLMGSDTENTIDTLFNIILNRIQQSMERSNERRSEFTHESVALLYYYFQRIDIRRAESYIMSPDWIVSKKAKINPKNEKDNECFKWSMISELNYNKINGKFLKK